MHGRLVEIEGVDASKREDLVSTIRDTVIPAMKEKGDFAGFISLVDAQAGRMRNVVLWETRESAEEFEREWFSRRAEILAGFGATVHSADLYEVLLAQLEAGAHA
jgi:hypothetical protein